MPRKAPTEPLSAADSKRILNNLAAIIGDKAELERRYQAMGTRRLMNAMRCKHSNREDAEMTEPKRRITFPDGLVLEGPIVGALMSPTTRVISPGRPEPEPKPSPATAKPHP